MQLNDYHKEALKTSANDLTEKEALAVWSLGLTGESGEVADLVKKYLGHGHSLDVDKVKKELGDVLWYVAAMADLLGITLEEIAEVNLRKLRSRYPQGFTAEASINRRLDD